jgi:hemolysin-activating ACP:hemolysin acyltransferase
MDSHNAADLTLSDAMRHMLRCVEAHASPAHVAVEMLAVCLLLPEDAKATFLRTMDCYYHDDTDPALWTAWCTFRRQLEGALLKAQALVQQGDRCAGETSCEEVEGTGEVRP